MWAAAETAANSSSDTLVPKIPWAFGIIKVEASRAVTSKSPNLKRLNRVVCAPSIGDAAKAGKLLINGMDRPDKMAVRRLNFVMLAPDRR